VSDVAKAELIYGPMPHSEAEQLALVNNPMCSTVLLGELSRSRFVYVQTAVEELLVKFPHLDPLTTPRRFVPVGNDSRYTVPEGYGFKNHPVTAAETLLQKECRESMQADAVAASLAIVALIAMGIAHFCFGWN
jgi:hypothetical protein